MDPRYRLWVVFNYVVLSLMCLIIGIITADTAIGLHWLFYFAAVSCLTVAVLILSELFFVNLTTKNQSVS
jgi:hypothetical protein